MIQRPIHILNSYRKGSLHPKMISFRTFQSIFKRHIKLCGFDALSISFNADYKLLSAGAWRIGTTGLPDLHFNFSRSLSVLNRIIRIFRKKTPSIQIDLPIHLLKSYSLVPKRSKLKGIQIMDFSTWVDGTVDDIQPLLDVKFGMYYLCGACLVPSDEEDNALLWILHLKHEIHDDKFERIKIKTPVAKKWISLISTILDAELVGSHCSVDLSCLKSFSITKGSKPKQSKLPEPPSDDDIPL